MMARIKDERVAFDTISQLGTLVAPLIGQPAGSSETPKRVAAQAIVEGGVPG